MPQLDVQVSRSPFEAVGVPARAGAWIRASRPQTLSLSLAPVAVGAVLAIVTQGRARWLAVVVAALAAALIQIGTNLYNDFADSRRGADGPARVGPQRVTATGVIDADQVAHAAFSCFALAALGGVYLALVGGWPILTVGVVSILCGWAYSGGPLPIAYTPFGEAFVLAFFGVVPVVGTYWLACDAYGPAPFVAGAAVGAFAAAVLLVNNHRDREEDARVGRRTLAILAGVKASGWIYATLMLAPYVLVAPLSRLLPGAPLWITLLSAPFALFLIFRFFAQAPGPGFNAVLALTARAQLSFAALLCLGALL